MNVELGERKLRCQAAEERMMGEENQRKFNIRKEKEDSVNGIKI